MCTFHSKSNEFPEVISLAAEEKEGFLHRVLENWFFFKTQKYKNCPRNNFLLFSSFGTVTVTTIFGILLSLGALWLLSVCRSHSFFEYVKSETKTHTFSFFFGYIASISAVFWHRSSIYRKQWEYCTNLYNDMVKEKDKFTAKLLENALAMDLVITDMWAHRSFKELFSGHLGDAIHDLYRDEPMTKISKIEEIKGKRLTETEALRILLLHQQSLAKQRNDHEAHGVSCKVCGI